MTKDRKETDTANGMGPGITGASGDLIEGTGPGQGIGGTGQDQDADAAGMRPDERNMSTSTREHLMGQAEGTPTVPTRPSGSATGTVGGGGPVTAGRGDNPGHAGGGGSGALGDVPGGVRNVSPANDADGESDQVHSGEGQDQSQRANQPRAGNPGTDDEH